NRGRRRYDRRRRDPSLRTSRCRWRSAWVMARIIAVCGVAGATPQAANSISLDGNHLFLLPRKIEDGQLDLAAGTIHRFVERLRIGYHLAVDALDDLARLQPCAIGWTIGHHLADGDADRNLAVLACDNSGVIDAQPRTRRRTIRG